jgi:transketolase
MISELAALDERLIVMTAENRAAIRTLPYSLGPRFLDVGIAEATMIGMAAGLALRGRQVLTHALASFLTLRAFEFIRDDVGIAHLPVICVGYVPGVLSEANGPTHQALEDVSLMRGIPNMGVFCPSDLEDLVLGLPHLIRTGDPFYVRYTSATPIARHDTDFEIGRGEVLFGRMNRRRAVTILTYGALAGEALAAAKVLAAEGVSITVANMRTLAPVDVEFLLDSARNSGLVVVVEDHFKHGGLYSILAEVLLDHGMRANVLSIAFDRRWFKPGLLRDVLQAEGMDAAGIAERIRSALQERMIGRSDEYRF